MAALEKQAAEQGMLLIDAQVAALEKKQDDDLAHGEIETVYPGSQDTLMSERIRVKMCCGRTPVQTLIVGKEARNEKVASLKLI